MAKNKLFEIFHSEAFRDSIASATEDLLGKEYIDQAISLWSSSFADNANPAEIRKFCKSFSTLIDKETLFQEYYFRLYDLYSKSKLIQYSAKVGSVNTPPSAAEARDQNRSPEPAAPSVKAKLTMPRSRRGFHKPDKIVIFETMLSHFIQRLSNGLMDDQSNVEGQNYIKEMVKQGLHPSKEKDCLDWLCFGAYRPEFVLDEKELSEMIHTIYLISAEVEGPVAADRILKAAVQAAESRPSAVNFPPQRLL